VAVEENLEFTAFIASLLNILAVIRLDIYLSMAAYIHTCMWLCMQVSKYACIDLAIHHNRDS